MEYNDKFRFWNRIASATSLPGNLTPKPQLKDIAHIKIAISATTTVDEAEELAEMYVMKFRAVGKLLVE